MHDLYFEFAEAEVKRDDKEPARAHLYHKNENNIQQCVTRNLRGAKSFPFERMRFSNVCNLDSFKQAKLDKCANVEVLKVDYCNELESLDIAGLEELRSLELLDCPKLEHLQGLENRDKLVWMRWAPCCAKVVDFKPLTSLRVLQLAGAFHSTPIDLRNCHNLHELAIRNSDGLKDFPLFPKSKSMRKISFAGCVYLRHRGPELLNLEGWMNVEFLELTMCQSVTNELESCPIMKNLKHLDVSDSHELKALPDLTKSTNLITLKVWGCSHLRSVYISEPNFWSFKADYLVEEAFSRSGMFGQDMVEKKSLRGEQRRAESEEWIMETVMHEFFERLSKFSELFKREPNSVEININ